MLFCKSWIDPEPECLTHDEVGILEVSDDTILLHIVDKCWLAKIISRKKQTGSDFFLIEVLHELFSIDKRLGADREDISEPAWFTIWSDLWKDEVFFHSCF